MPAWERTSMELPRDSSGLKELRMWEGVASMWMMKSGWVVWAEDGGRFTAKTQRAQRREMGECLSWRFRRFGGLVVFIQSFAPLGAASYNNGPCGGEWRTWDWASHFWWEAVGSRLGRRRGRMKRGRGIWLIR